MDETELAYNIGDLHDVSNKSISLQTDEKCHSDADETLQAPPTSFGKEGENSNSPQGVRSSSRVSKKMRLDSTSCPAVTSGISVSSHTVDVLPGEKKELFKEDEKSEARVQNDKPKRRPTELWPVEDKNTFFEALNEYGKDFEAIEKYFACKAKKKGLPEQMAKNKVQIRHFYHRTWHKISKHLKFPDGVKKVTQELYALINYGELRKKISVITEKTCVKLNDLIYKGFTLIRLRGKTIRVRTPMCRALRKLNHLEELQEELKLPSRVTIELRPKDISAWVKVHTLAQNPRIRTTLPLQRRLSVLLNFLYQRWRPHQLKYLDKLLSSAGNSEPGQFVDVPKTVKESTLRVAPLPGVEISIPTVNLNEYLTSSSLCFSAHQERLMSWEDQPVQRKNTQPRKTNKRQRTDSGSFRKETIFSEEKNTSLILPLDFTNLENNACDACDNVDLLGITMPDSTVISNSSDSEKQTDEDCLAASSEPPEAQLETEKDTDAILLDHSENSSTEDAILKIRKGWSLDDVQAVSVGELYLMFGKDSKIQLEYWWEDSCLPVKDSSPAVQPNSMISLALKKLVSMAKIYYKKAKVSCPCGHVCGGQAKTTNAARSRFRQNPDLEKKLNIEKPIVPLNPHSRITVVPSPVQDGVFRKPLLAPSQYKMLPKPSSVEEFRAQLDKFRPRYCNRRGRTVRSRNVLVQRTLPLLPKAPNGHAMVALKVVSQPTQLSGEFVPLGAANSSMLNFPVAHRPVLPKPEPVLRPAISQTAINIGKLPVTKSDFDTTDQPEDCLNPTNDSCVISPVILTEPKIPNLLGMGSKDGDKVSFESNRLPSTSETSEFSDLLLNEALQPSSTPPPSPIRILKEDETQWLTSEVADFSLSSFLGHLDSPVKSAVTTNITSIEDTRLSTDVESQLQCLMSENSLDYMAKFADLAAQIASSDTNSKK